VHVVKDLSVWNIVVGFALAYKHLKFVLIQLQSPPTLTTMSCNTGIDPLQIKTNFRYLYDAAKSKKVFQMDKSF